MTGSRDVDHDDDEDIRDVDELSLTISGGCYAGRVEVINPRRAVWSLLRAELGVVSLTKEPGVCVVCAWNTRRRGGHARQRFTLY